MGTLCSGFPCFLCSDSASVLQPCLPLRAESSPSSVLRDILPGGLCDSRGTLEIWDVCGYRRISDALSDVAAGCQSSPSLHPCALCTQQQHLHSAWGLDLDYLPSPACSPHFHVCFLFTFSIQDVNGRWFFFFWFQGSSHRSLSAIQPLKLVRLITSTFWNWKPRRPAFILLKLSQFVENRLELSDHKWLLLQHPHYLPKASLRITSGLLSACFVLKSVGSYRAPLLVFVLLSISAI